MRTPFARSFGPLCLAMASSTFALPTSASLSSSTISQVKSNLASSSSDTWVSGAQTIALLEYDFPTLSVFSPVNLTTILTSDVTPIPVSTNEIIAGWWALRPADSVQLVEVSGGAAGDPASLGVAWMLAALTDGGMELKLQYAEAIEEEIDFLLETVPRTTDGAISMRGPGDAVQLWADFIYQVPPTLAYYGQFTSNTSFLLEACNQCSLYRTYLQDPTTSLWQHIVLGSYQDYGLWGTGNAWAAAGMARVLATMQNGTYAEHLRLPDFRPRHLDQRDPLRRLLANKPHDEPLAELLPRNWFEVR